MNCTSALEIKLPLLYGIYQETITSLPIIVTDIKSDLSGFEAANI